MGFKTLLTKTIPEPGPSILQKACEKVDWNKADRDLTREELIEKVRGKDGIVCLLTDKIDAEILKAAASTGCKVFANYAVGYNNIDVKVATELGIAVTNTPGVLTDTTADLTWALLMSVARRIPEGDVFMRAGKYTGWSPTLLLGTDVWGKTLGIVGAGRIGTEVALRSRGFRMKILYTDAFRNAAIEKDLGAKQVALEELLKESDYVSLHVPLDQATTHLIGERELGMMKPGAYLINTCRGPVVDEKALVKALKSNTIAGAALDVYEEVPKMAPGLAECANAVIIPHLGSGTKETRSKMAQMAAENCVAAIRDQRPPNIVNPEVLDRKR